MMTKTEARKLANGAWLFRSAASELADTITHQAPTYAAARTLRRSVRDQFAAAYHAA